MCGITGFTWHEPGLLRRMSKRLTHRGPDQHSSYSDKQVSFGHRRLSIIDLSKQGRQPMSNEDGTVWITFNGEIYNYLDLKPDLEQKGHRFSSATDTEVIIHLYEEYGEQCVQKLWGDFAFAIYDSVKKKLFLARDRIGVKPLYYSFDTKTKEFLFASEIKAILAYERISRKINLSALRQYLTYRYVFGKHTIFTSVERVLSGECLTFDLRTKKITSKIYWDVDPSTNTIVQASEHYYVKQFLKLYEDSVQRRLMSDVPLGIYLSGGIDSSSITAMLHNIKKKANDTAEIETFSIGFGTQSDELPYSREVATFFNTNHHEFILESDSAKTLPTIIWHCDEPLADPALIPNYFLSQEAKKHVTVVLTGDGGDETFLGYEQAKFMHLAHRLQKIPLAASLASTALCITPLSSLNKIFKYSSALGNKGIRRAQELLQTHDKQKAYTAITGLFNDKEIETLSNNTIQQTPSASLALKPFFDLPKTALLNKIAYLEIKTLLPENMLMKSDKMTMAHAIEARVPLLDHRITELSFKMPPHLKLNGWKEKYILKKSMQGKLPKNITQRKKQRFYVPIDHWIEDDLMPLTHTLLSPQTIHRQGYFTYDYIKKIFEKYPTAPLFYARQIWTLATFQIWHALYIDNIKPTKIL